MASIRLSQDNPTLSQALPAMRGALKNGKLNDLTKQELIRACQKRRVVIKDGRIQNWNKVKADLYFEIAHARGIIDIHD